MNSKSLFSLTFLLLALCCGLKSLGHGQTPSANQSEVDPSAAAKPALEKNTNRFSGWSDPNNSLQIGCQLSKDGKRIDYWIRNGTTNLIAINDWGLFRRRFCGVEIWQDGEWKALERSEYFKRVDGLTLDCVGPSSRENREIEAGRMIRRVIDAPLPSKSGDPTARKADSSPPPTEAGPEPYSSSNGTSTISLHSYAWPKSALASKTLEVRIIHNGVSVYESPTPAGLSRNPVKRATVRMISPPLILDGPEIAPHTVAPPIPAPISIIPVPARGVSPALTPNVLEQQIVPISTEDN